MSTHPAATPTRRSIWSEYTPYEKLTDPDLLGELSRRQIELAVAVTPPLAPAIAEVLKACRRAGVQVALWPMLADAQGRWASAKNAAAYCLFVRELLAALAAQDALPQALAIDLEPPIDNLRRLLRTAKGAPTKGEDVGEAGPGATRRFAELLEEVRARGLGVLAAVVPLVMVPSDAAARGWQKLLQTPVDALPCDRVSTMVYTSILQGYSRGVIRRDDARTLLGLMAQATHARYGARASVSLGAVGTGALGDERVYENLSELVEDVGIVRATGVDDLALFNLDGVLARPPIARWLDALVQTPPAANLPVQTLRARTIWRLLTVAGHLGRG